MVTLATRITVRSLMNKDIISVDAKETVWDAANIMMVNGIGSVVVVREGKPVGILTERDILGRVVLPKLDSSKVKVEQVMSSQLITTDADTSIQDAARLMIEKKIRRLLVTEGGKVVGIVTQKDLQHQLLNTFTALTYS